MARALALALVLLLSLAVAFPRAPAIGGAESEGGSETQAALASLVESERPGSDSGSENVRVVSELLSILGSHRDKIKMRKGRRELHPAHSHTTQDYWSWGSHKHSVTRTHHSHITAPAPVQICTTTDCYGPNNVKTCTGPCSSLSGGKCANARRVLAETQLGAELEARRRDLGRPALFEDNRRRLGSACPGGYTCTHSHAATPSPIYTSKTCAKCAKRTVSGGNGGCISGETYHGYSCTASCKAGYTRSGSATLSCSEGSFTGSFTCGENSCALSSTNGAWSGTGCGGTTATAGRQCKLACLHRGRAVIRPPQASTRSTFRFTL